MASKPWLPLFIFGIILPLVTSNEAAFFDATIKLNEPTKPLRILGFFPYNGYSHFIMFKALMVGLAKRGHEVTVVSPFPLKSPIGNYIDIDLSDRFPALNGKRTFKDWTTTFEGHLYSRVAELAHLNGPQYCRDTFTHPEVRKLLKRKNDFDIVFVESFGSDCFSVVGYILQAPTITMVSSTTVLWMHDYLGETNHPAFVPNHFFIERDTDLLGTVWERLQNTFYSLSSKFLYYFLVTRPSEAVLREVLGKGIPSIAEIRHNISLVMWNNHLSIFGAKPTVPRVLHVGGIHLEPPDSRKIPLDIKTWLDTAPAGVLYFSLGSLIDAKSLPDRLKSAFTEAFAELKPLRVLWKFDNDEKKIPENVKLASWLPQIEILSHPNVLAFMTHGGLMSVIETVYYGVPSVGIPIFADQLINMNTLERLGCAVQLNHKTLTKDDVVKAVVKATTDPKVRRRAGEVSHQFKDRALSPLDEAVWWTEYIVRHSGAAHLESVTARMPFWKYALLDVFILAVVLVVLPLSITYFGIAHVVKAVSSKKMSGNKKDD